MHGTRWHHMRAAMSLTVMTSIPIGGSLGPAQLDCSSRLDGHVHRAVLTRQYGLSESHLTDLDDGKLVKGVIPTQDKHDIAMLVVAKASVTRDQFLRFASHAASFASGGHVRQAGLIDPGTTVEDLVHLEIQQDDVDAVQSCRPGDCDMKLPASIIREIAALDGGAAGFSDSVRRLVSGWLGRYLTDYLSRGNTALVVYADREQPQPMRRATGRLHTGASILAQEAPPLHRFLEAGGSDDSLMTQVQLFWAVQDCGARPLTTILQHVVYASDDRPKEAWVATKLIYATHYLQASLTSMRVIEDNDDKETPVS